MDNVTDEMLEKLLEKYLNKDIENGIRIKQEQLKNRQKDSALFAQDLSRVYFKIADVIMAHLSDHDLPETGRPLDFAKKLFHQLDNSVEEYARNTAGQYNIYGVAVVDGVFRCWIANDDNKKCNWGIYGESILNSKALRALFDGEQIAITDRQYDDNPLCLLIKRENGKYDLSLRLRDGVYATNTHADNFSGDVQLTFVANAIKLAHAFILKYKTLKKAKKATHL